MTVRAVGAAARAVGARRRPVGHRPRRRRRRRRERVATRDESGTALVEFVWLAILLIVPLLYIVLAAFDTQRAAYAASALRARPAAPSCTAPDQATGYARAGRRCASPTATRRSSRGPTCGSPADPTRATASRRARWCAPRSHSSVALPLMPAALGVEHADASGSTPSTRRRTAPSARPAREARDERGSVTPLIIGFAVVVAMLVAVVVDASAAYLRRQGLNSAADAAALAATDGIQGEQVYTHGLGKRAEIDPAAARRYVADVLREQRHPPPVPRPRLLRPDHRQHRRRPHRHADGPAAPRARGRHQRPRQRYGGLGGRGLRLTDQLGRSSPRARLVSEWAGLPSSGSSEMSTEV